MPKSLLIAGAKGFAKELLAMLSKHGEYADVRLFDDISRDIPEFVYDRFPVIRTETQVIDFIETKNPSLVLGVGDPVLRQEFFERFTSLGVESHAMISPEANIGPFENHIGECVTILPGVIIESSNSIGRGSLIHVGAFISHDVVVGEFCEISPRVNLLGNVKVGNKCRLGTGCTILPNVEVGNEVTIGAGAVVTKDLRDGVTVVGVPARSI